MTTQPTQEAWDYFTQHHDNIREVCVEYLHSALVTRFDDAVKNKNVVQLAGLMNKAWFKAPDDRRVYQIPGFTQMCNLLDGTVDGFLGIGGPDDDDDDEEEEPGPTTVAVSPPEIPRGHALLIIAEGSEQLLGSVPDYATRATLLACKAFDRVNIGKLLPPDDPRSDLVMIIDGHGYESELVYQDGNQVGEAMTLELRPRKPLKPVNKRATEYYHAICVPGTTHEIVGDVLIIHDGDS